MILDIFKKKDRIQFVVVLILFIFLQWRYGKFSAHILYAREKVHRVFVISLYILFLMLVPYTYEEYSSFLKTAIDYYGTEKIVAVPVEKYPYTRVINNPSKVDQPHIFVITVESFNANMVLNQAKNGKELTPFFNSLTREGLFFKNFYGHSIQTAKGHLSIYCSLLPLTKKKVFVSYPDIGIKCLPHVLKEAGYTNYFFKAYSNVNFDNTHYFAKRMGFDHIHGMNSKFVSKEERKKSSWGWGIQDSLFYTKFFEYLDNNRGEKIFAALTTVSNHMKFKRVPENQRYIYPGQNGKHARYANSIRVSDEYLKTFFLELKKREYLRNSIVIITGDHSYPWGEHGIYSNENGYYDENFKTPLVIIGPEISHKVIHERHSQVDIAPGLMELLGLSAVVPFRGKSFFQKNEGPIHLIQPYDGRYLAVIVGKYKYIYHQRTKREICYDLDSDPMEKNNIIGNMVGSSSHQTFKKGIEEIALNDYLIANDRIWEKK